MIINTEKKYSPQSLDEFIFPNEESHELITAYASGDIERPLILYGSSGSGKSLLQRLIPNAIEKKTASIKTIKCADLKTPSAIHDLYGRNKQFNENFTVDNQRFNYIIIEEFLMTSMKLVDAMKIELDKTLGTDLTILSTNRFAKVDDGIVSRCETLELKPCEPQIFFPHAKKIFDSEHIDVDANSLMNHLEISYALRADNRKYYSTLDAIFRKNKGDTNGIPS